MPVNQQNMNISFAEGLDTKSDPFQVRPGKFLSLKNTIFSKAGLLQKRNGFGALTSLPNTNYVDLTTFNGNLTAISPTNFQAYSSGSAKWINKGSMQNLSLSVLSLIKNNSGQSKIDAVVSPNNLTCVTYFQGSTYTYAIIDSLTGQNIIPPTAITSTGAVTNAPRVFLLHNFFVIVFDSVISATNHLQYIAVNIYSLLATTAADISASYTPAATGSFDGVVVNGNLYLAWNGADGGNAIRMTYLDSTLTQHGTVTFASRIATLMSVCADTTTNTPVIYAVFYNSGTSTGYALAVNQTLVTVHAPTQIIASGTYLNLTSVAQNGVCSFFGELSNNYGYDSSIPTHYVNFNTITQSGTVGTAAIIVRSVGLASKAFIVSGSIYFLGIYYSINQPTYFLVSGSGKVVSKLAYQNAGTYIVTGIPNISVIGNVVYIPYLFKDLIVPVNKAQGAATSTAVYTQNGINQVAFDFTPNINTAETANNLHLSGGFLWMYDGYLPVEHNFFVYPDSIQTTVSHSGGSMTVQDYYYQVIYQWTDNQGNIFNSAPSIPVIAASAGFTASSNSVTVNIPYLRLTYKTANPVKIVIYRWSTAQQSYFQVTSITAPTLNLTTTDSIAYIDTLADASIIGNSLIYTTGGIVENISAPATSIMSLYNSRLILVDAEDPNLLWYSKQVIEAVPVEMSDLFTIFIAPTTGSQFNSGPISALYTMDDKLIIFKKAGYIYYMNFKGPDNLGTNSDILDPVFITSVVGCNNPKSIVLTPAGLMFQSDKGIWLLGRDLSTSYIGAPVEEFNSSEVVSALIIPGTNQVRFILDNGVTLMYDYYYQQWGSFYGISNISSILYQDLHTFIDEFGRVFQETPNQYLDGNNPVLIQFQTSWFNLGGLQGLQRAFEFYFLGSYISPHKLQVQVAYDYNPNPIQTNIISPDNYTGPYGSDTLYGGSQFYGGYQTLEQWRIFLVKQKVQSFQISIQEIFDPSFGVPAGAGFTLSGINLTVGILKTRPLITAKRTVG